VGQRHGHIISLSKILAVLHLYYNSRKCLSACVCVMCVCPSSNSSKTTGTRIMEFCTQVGFISGYDVIYIS